MMTKVCLILLALFAVQIHSFPHEQPLREVERLKRQQGGFDWGDTDFNNQNGQNNNNIASTSAPTTTTTASPRYTACHSACPKTPEYNPACGNNGVTYQNDSYLKCANTCGVRVRKVFSGTCSPL